VGLNKEPFINGFIDRPDNRLHPTLFQNEPIFDYSFDYYTSMKTSDLTNKQKRSVPCPICAAAVGEHCKMYSGFSRRNEPHSERKYFAIQVIEQDYASISHILNPVNTLSS
jgi:hypothetical protein